MGLSRQAMYFSMDALLAAMLILGGFYFIYQLSVTESPTEHLDYLSKDLLVALDAIPVASIDHSFIQQELANGNITSPENTILEQIAEYWARDENAKAEQLASIALAGVVPPSMGLRVRMKPDLIYEQPHSTNAGVIASRRMISGIEKGKPLQGSSSYGYLRNIQDKRSSAYAYFGGFIGQGNITVQLEPLPDDVNATRIEGIALEADMARNFTVSINGIHCADLEPSTGGMVADEWDLSSCDDSLAPGNNTFTISFDSLNNAYVGGGFIRVEYETDYFFTNKSYTTTRYQFPGVEGVINLYDSFYVPGTLIELEIRLHYYANHSNTSNPLYLTVGNTVVHLDTNSTEPVAVTLTDLYLSSLLDYSLMSNATIPFRLGFENLTYSTEYEGNGDVVVVTDTSGSMKWNLTTNWGEGVPRNCSDPLIYHDSSQRISIAKCLDKDFATQILNVSGNMVALIGYNDDIELLNLTDNITLIEEEIGMGSGWPPGYGADGSTCVCCGINGAVDVLKSGVARTLYIDREENWYYWNESLAGGIPRDGAGRDWFHPDYALASSWPSGQAVLGHDGGTGGVVIATELGSNLRSHRSRVLVGPNDLAMDLWELSADKETPEADFTSGLNSTANTYGLGAGDDGWDWSSGTFD
ncbi:hypothetical protein JXA12_03680, partial [Candidatus Woesearchaeota archaeon]|nr:hypothetical protein [Candidatus Woesearchaeota archaeon]